MPRFCFSLVVALEHAEAEQRACEEALAEARLAVTAARVRVEEITLRIEAARQQIAEAHDKMVSPRDDNPPAVMAGMAFIDGQRNRVAEWVAARRPLTAEVRLAEHKVTLGARDLADAVARVDFLNRLRAIELEEHRRMLSRREELMQEELATLKMGRNT